MNVILDNLGATVVSRFFLHFSIYFMNGEVVICVPYYMTFSRHIYLAILRFVYRYFMTLKFYDLFSWQWYVKILKLDAFKKFAHFQQPSCMNRLQKLLLEYSLWLTFISAKWTPLLVFTFFWTCKRFEIHLVVINLFFLDFLSNVSFKFCITKFSIKKSHFPCCMCWIVHP